MCVWYFFALHSGMFAEIDWIAYQIKIPPATTVYVRQICEYGQINELIYNHGTSPVYYLD